MKQIGINLDDDTIQQIQELAERWGLPEVRHNAAVISRCVERVWMLEIGYEKLKKKENENRGSIDNLS